MVSRIEIVTKPGVFDAIGDAICSDITDLGIDQVRQVRFVQVYNLCGHASEREIKKIAEELLVDRVIQDYSINPRTRRAKAKGQFIVEVAHNPGVMDPVGDSALKGIRDLGISSIQSISAAKKYIIKGSLTKLQIKTITEKLLYNKLIQHIVYPSASRVDQLSAEIPKAVKYKFKLIIVDFLSASDKQLEKISQKGQLFLNLEEMRQIKNYFKKIGRNPTDCELETIAQTWSEHCGHKTFRGKIEYQEKTEHKKEKTEIIDNLLKSTIMKATKELNKPWCVSVFKDNAGIINFDQKNNICFKVETHNHPSALEPFGGANTGIGGVIRDPLGTGLGAKPILNTDVFCFAPPDLPFSKVPKGSLHPKRVMKGVVSGVRDYGNKMGIPTVNGAILFDQKFIGNPLVYCGTVGVLPREKSFKQVKKNDLVVVVGGRTGRDGIHGATFSSGELTHESETVSSGAVQIGNPIQEKKMVDVIIKARDKNLYNAITDCGAGGLSSAVGEMGEELGARVDIEKVPLKYQGLSYTETWISESQERMVLSVPKKNIKALLKLFKDEDVEAVVIGSFTGSKHLKLYYNNKQVCDLDMHFLHKGLPQIVKKAKWHLTKHKEPQTFSTSNLTKKLFKVLSHYNICSKEWVIRQYDHEVQGGSVVKPLTGVNNDGPSDAAVVRPFLGSDKGIIVSNGINFRYGFIDPYWMAASSIDEALRQIISVGGSLKEVAILDNFCWGNPDKPDRLGALVRASKACYDIAKGFSVPFISGKDSLYNEYTINSRSIAIPGTLLISAIAIFEDTTKAVSSDLKNPGNLIYIVGQTFEEMGASIYYDTLGYIGNSVPRVNVKTAKAIFDVLARASSKGLVQAMHDCSDGGLAVACAEMAFSGGLGVEIFLSEVPYKNQKARNDIVLFSESNSRFIVEVRPEDQKKFENSLKGTSFGLIGCVSGGKDFKVYGLNSKPCIKANIDDLKEAWQKPLRW